MNTTAGRRRLARPIRQALRNKTVVEGSEIGQLDPGAYVKLPRNGNGGSVVRCESELRSEESCRADYCREQRGGEAAAKLVLNNQLSSLAP